MHAAGGPHTGCAWDRVVGPGALLAGLASTTVRVQSARELAVSQDRNRGITTLTDVAREAGVSLATASRALNGSTRRVREDMRQRVLRARRSSTCVFQI
ncbi:LacI family DNA-binding transcriptional regulator [Micromonospora sp. SL1-18]|uniref:LacI family DNA-binding transcriptional regulator n=1 Tax=Micromonospora sp. SL1-18 TaxID=3399128 RepID=UPI003A4D9227